MDGSAIEAIGFRYTTAEPTVQLLQEVSNTVYGKYLAGGKFGEPYKKMLLARQISYSQCICQIHFQCIYDYWRGKFWRIAYDSPNLLFFVPAKIFPCTIYSICDVMTLTQEMYVHYNTSG